MDEFGKKIASILNEAPLDKRIEDRKPIDIFANLKS